MKLVEEFLRSIVSFNTVNGKYCCNDTCILTEQRKAIQGFNTVNGQNMLPFDPQGLWI